MDFNIYIQHKTRPLISTYFKNSTSQTFIFREKIDLYSILIEIILYFSVIKIRIFQALGLKTNFQNKRVRQNFNCIRINYSKNFQN